MGNLFANAKKAEPTTKKATEYEVLVLPVEYQTKLADLSAMKIRLKADEANSAMIEEEIKSLAAQHYIDRSRELGRPVGNILVTATGTGAKFLCAFKDAYRKVADADAAEDLKKKYGENIVTVSRKYVFNESVLEKYQQEISDALVAMFNRMPITAEEREIILSTMFTVEEKYSIAKGAIQTCTTREDIGEFLADIQPQVAITDRSGK